MSYIEKNKFRRRFRIKHFHNNNVDYFFGNLRFMYFDFLSLSFGYRDDERLLFVFRADCQHTRNTQKRERNGISYILCNVCENYPFGYVATEQVVSICKCSKNSCNPRRETQTFKNTNYVSQYVRTL